MTSKADTDKHARAKKRYEQACEVWGEQHKRMREDLEFSNPSDPKQWDSVATEARKGRVMLTLDRTNQYIVQIVNDARKNKPGITTMPADSKGDPAVAQALDGIIRHIEYRSRAPIAYDTAIDHSARCGLGWLRIVPQVVRADTNEQEICIKRVHDPLSVMTLGGTEPDGSDITDAFVATRMSKSEFKREFPKAKTESQSWGAIDNVWFFEDEVTICEWFYIEETERNQIRIENDDGESFTVSEDDYWDLAKKLGFKPKVVETFKATDRVVHWCKLNGAEVLDATTFPSRYIPVIPVLGFESWVDGKRQLCGVTRRLMGSQRAYNYERSAMVEAIALQPKAPILVPVAGVEGHDLQWGQLNKGSPAYLPFNHVDAEGNPFPTPQRLAPPQVPAAFAQAGQAALADMESAIGIRAAGLGAVSNETSGKAIRERKEESDTATYHFLDNLSRGIEHLARIVVDMVPRIFDTKRQARILGNDGAQDAVTIDPTMGEPVQRQGKKVVAINPGVGEYDVRVIAGANYTTQRQEAAEGIAEILQAAPQFIPVLGPALVKLRDWPDAEKYARMMTALAPPQVQQAISEAEGDEGSPEQLKQQLMQMQQQMQQMQQQGQQMGQMLEQGAQQLQTLQAENQALKADKELEAFKARADAANRQRELEIDAARAETERFQAEVAASRPPPVETEPVDLTQ
jgi:hypothetical protein